MGQPEEIAHAVLWLCSDAALFVVGHATGQVEVGVIEHEGREEAPTRHSWPGAQLRAGRFSRRSQGMECMKGGSTVTPAERVLAANLVTSRCLSECEGDVDAALSAAELLLTGSQGQRANMDLT